MLPGWSRHLVAGKPVDAFDPPAVRHVVLYLHPVGGELPSDNPAYTAAFVEHGFAVVAPHGGPSWWADRVCPEFDAELTAEGHLLRNVLPFAEARYSRPVRAVCGISTGGQGAIRLALKHPDRFPVAASVAGAFDYHLWHGLGTPIDAMYPDREACRRDTAVLHVSGPPYPPHLWLACDPDDDWFPGNDRLHEKLTAFGVPHAHDFETTHGGHTWAYFDRMAGSMTAFLANGLQQVGRALL